ncbi:hypothetical protein C8F04DRAFT_1245194 [Mycena alexandri]|uniref:Uncharacterized protein n=1 Tax=Mycena alexandri TaxID=1745969 RepID=A0AAD6WK64_9AGAR|nr:hypothetical protein C8F04DRAFT_1245194 [Mycena alexandri]
MFTDLLDLVARINRMWYAVYTRLPPLAVGCRFDKSLSPKIPAARSPSQASANGAQALVLIFSGPLRTPSRDRHGDFATTHVCDSGENATEDRIAGALLKKVEKERADVGRSVGSGARDWGCGSRAQGETHSGAPVRLSNPGRGRGELGLGCVTYALPTRGAAVAPSAVVTVEGGAWQAGGSRGRIEDAANGARVVHRGRYFADEGEGMRDDDVCNRESWWLSRAVAVYVVLGYIRARPSSGESGTARKMVAGRGEERKRALLGARVVLRGKRRLRAAGVMHGSYSWHGRRQRPDRAGWGAGAAGAAHAGGRADGSGELRMDRRQGKTVEV